MGCEFALDDFGAGFGSFYYLKHLPVDYLKIDGEFVRGLPRSQIDQRMVKAMVEIARGLELRTIAECVETAETLELLQEYGVDFAQGYHLGRPGPTARRSASGPDRARRATPCPCVARSGDEGRQRLAGVRGPVDERRGDDAEEDRRRGERRGRDQDREAAGARRRGRRGAG